MSKKRLHSLSGKGKFAQTMAFVDSRYGLPLPRRFPPKKKPVPEGEKANGK